MAKPLQLEDCRTRDQFAKIFVGQVETMARHNRKVDVFRDFLELATCSISNSMMFSQAVEDQYMKTAGKYGKDEAAGFPLLLAITVEALDFLRDDFLGHVYMSQEMAIAEAGQFFTPSCVADMMGKMTLAGMKEVAEQKGYVTVNDPACGGGVQLIGAYKAALEQDMNPSTQLCVYAEDIDTTCVYMTYVQLSLLGLPALVSHRNTISMETWAQWRSPVWWLHGFEYRERRRHKEGAVAAQAEAAPVRRVPMRKQRALELERLARPACDVDLKQPDLFAM